MISEAFAIKVQAIARNKTALLELMNELDEEKRQLRTFMRQYSNEPKTEGGGSGPERYRKLRAIKAREGFLIEEREYVRQKLAALKAEQKALNRAGHRRDEFCRAFLAAAEMLLEEELFLEIEAKAASIITGSRQGQPQDRTEDQ